MIVADLAALLGLKVDARSFAEGAKAFDRLAAHGQQKLRDSAKHFDQIVLDTSRAARGAVADAVVTWEGWNGAIKKTTTWMERVRGLMSHWKGIMVGAFVGQRALGGLARFIGEVTGGAGRVKDLSEQTGLATQTIQEYGHAAEMNGSSMAGMTTGFRAFTRAATAASKGGEEQARAFREVGVSAKGVIKGTVPLDTALGKIADKFKSMPDGQEKSRLAMALFGKQGVELIPTLNQGRKGLEALRKEAHDLGLVMSDETLKSLDEMDDEMDRAKASWRGLKIDLVTAVIPALRSMIDGLREWFKANRALIKQTLTKALKLLLLSMKAIGKAVSLVVKGIDFFAKRWRIVVAGAVSLILFKLIPAIAALKMASITAAIASAKAWLVGMAPLALMAVAVAGVAILLEDLYVAFMGGDSLIKDAWNGALEAVMAAWQGFFDWYQKNMIRLGLMKGEDVLGDLGIEKANAKARQGPRVSHNMDWTGKANVAGVAKEFATDETQKQLALRRGIYSGRYQPGSDVLDKAKTEHVQDRIGRLKAEIAFEKMGYLKPRDGGITVNNGDITVNATTGAGPGDIAQEIVRQQKQFWDEAIRDADAGIGAGSAP